MKRLAVVSLLILITAATAIAQRSRGNSSDSSISLQVRIVADNEHAITTPVRVELLPATGSATLMETTAESDGMAELILQHNGQFRLRVSGMGVETTTTDSFIVDPEARQHMEFVHVKLKQSANGASNAPGGLSGANDYQVPKDAEKAFDAGVVSLRSNDWKGAEKHFQEAIDKYPKFDRAYDNLGIARQNANDLSGAKVAYAKALELNDHNADAQRNMARLYEGDKNWARAEDMLQKSMSVEPNNAGALTLMAIAEIEQGKLDEAISFASRVHALEHKSYAVAHFVLARAYELKGRMTDAIAEYRMFLSEEPSGPRSEVAKKKLAKLSAG
jgi:Flp pilus assembly protein TadD